MLDILETSDALNDGLIPAEALRVSGINSHTIGGLVKHGELRRVRLEDERKAGIRGALPITKDVLLTELAVVHPRVGWRTAHRTIAFANGLSANPGESLSRVQFEELGFEIPDLQVRFDVKGRTFYVDYLWRGVRKIGEFDGDMKYTRAAVMDGKDVVGVVKAEKSREDLLRPLVNSFDRWDWDLAFNTRDFYRFLSERDVPRACDWRPGKRLPAAALV